MGCFIGNALEWFDFAIYGYLAGVLGLLFFPTLDPYAALLSSYGIFAAAFIMRPMGAILFGHLGDKWGRKKAFLWSLGGMAVPTMMIGLLPVYEDIGMLAPASLLVCRMVQGLSLGGEFSGSIILLTEHAPAHRKGFFSSWADIGSAVGMMGASLGILLLHMSLTETELRAWGWRLPFLISFFFAIAGYRMRSHLKETPEFLAQGKVRPSSPWPLTILFQKYKRKMTLAVGLMMVNSAGYYLIIVFIPHQNFKGYPPAYAALATGINLMVMMPAMVWGGIVSDKIGQVRSLMMGYGGCLILAFPVLYSAKYGGFPQQTLYQSLFSLSLGFCFGPRSSFVAQIFPTAVRYSAVGLSYNLGNAFFGGTAPLICAVMVEQTGTILAPTAYIIAVSLTSIISVSLLGRDLSFKKPFTPKLPVFP